VEFSFSLGGGRKKGLAFMYAFMSALCVNYFTSYGLGMHTA
jgi:hypothetical protein